MTSQLFDSSAAVQTVPQGAEAPVVAAAHVVAYPPHAVLTEEEVAAWLKVSVRTVQRYTMKRVQLGDRTTRYLAKHIYEWLESRAT